jgi:SAM-dependent methyltransferase
MAKRDLLTICPACLVDSGRESLLNDCKCPECGVIYPVVEEVPVLIADDQCRAAITRGDWAADSRTSFYQHEDAYLRVDLVANEELENAFKESHTGGVVLEIGSGAGALQNIGGPDYCGLDYSLRSLHKFLSGNRRICASAETIPLPGESCSFIFSVATLEHVPDPSRSFTEIDRLLAPGGVAYLAPAWHCREWMADGLPARPYRDLNWSQRLRKASIPLRDSLLYRGLKQVPWRIWRRITVKLKSAPSELRYSRLDANYEIYWGSDSDACSSIDSHEGMLFFESRKYEILSPKGGTLARLASRGNAIVVRKPLCRRAHARRSVPPSYISDHPSEPPRRPKPNRLYCHGEPCSRQCTGDRHF